MDAYVRESDPPYSRYPIGNFSFLFSIDYFHIFSFLLTLMSVLSSCADNFVLILILYLSFNNFPSLHLLGDFIQSC